MQTERPLDIEKIRAEISKMIAETSKINRENAFYPFIVGATVTLVMVAVVKVFLWFLSGFRLPLS